MSPNLEEQVPSANSLEAPAGPLSLGRGATADFTIWLGLMLAIFAIYAQSIQFNFVNFDDNVYVYGNAAVQSGLTLDSIRSAFTSVVVGNWVPATMLSHMAVSQFFHLESGMHHATNVLLHLLAAILLFASLRRATGALWPSAFAAFLFAGHPLHVESVAWVSERKDTLSTFFWFLALYAYIRYAEKPSLRRYLLMATPFCLGLMSKPMLVTFPFTLMLLDVWPLRRWQWPKMLWEKLPLIVLSAAASLLSYLTQQSEGFVFNVPLAMRIEHSLVSYVTYIGQMFWPARLSVFYPYPDSTEGWKAVGCAVVLAGVSALAIFAWRTRPYLATGWFWYLGTLLPVIGLVKVGQQSHADRYTYVPMVGLSVMIAWGAAEVVERWPRTKPAMGAAAVICCVVLLVLASKQTGYWRDSETLYRHSIDVTGDNWLAEGNLGDYLMKIPGRHEEALDHLQAALRIRPQYAEAENNLGLCLAQIELCGAAIPHFEEALRINAKLVQAHNNLGLCLTRNGDYGPALDHLRTAVRLQPDFAAAHFNLAVTLSKMAGHDQEAIAEYETGLRANNAGNSDKAAAHRNLGILLMGLGREEEAIAHLEAAQAIRPDPEVSGILDDLRSKKR